MHDNQDTRTAAYTKLCNGTSPQSTEKHFSDIYLQRKKLLRYHPCANFSAYSLNSSHRKENPLKNKPSFLLSILTQSVIKNEKRINNGEIAQKFL